MFVLPRLFFTKYDAQLAHAAAAVLIADILRNVRRFIDAPLL
jgi:hypothetical protein